MTKLETLAIAYRMALQQEENLKQAADFLVEQVAIAKEHYHTASREAADARAALCDHVAEGSKSGGYFGAALAEYARGLEENPVVVPSTLTPSEKSGGPRKA